MLLVRLPAITVSRPEPVTEDVRYLGLDQPEKLNAPDVGILGNLATAVSDAEEQVLVVGGRSHSFGTGSDLDRTAEDTTFCLPEATIGAVVSNGVMRLLSLVVGDGFARDMIQ